VTSMCFCLFDLQKWFELTSSSLLCGWQEWQSRMHPVLLAPWFHTAPSEIPLQQQQIPPSKSPIPCNQYSNLCDELLLSSSLPAAKNFLSVVGRVGTFFQWSFFFSSYSPTLQQLMVHTRHTSFQEDPTRYYPKEKNTKSATSSKLGAHTIPPKKSKPTKAQSNAKPKTFLLLKKEEVRCKGSSSYIYKQYYWTPQEAEAVVLYYYYNSYELWQAAPTTSCLQMQTCHTHCNSRAPSSFPSIPDEEEHSSCPMRRAGCRLTTE
jgi:hypothetical protein